MQRQLGSCAKARKDTPLGKVLRAVLAATARGTPGAAKVKPPQEPSRAVLWGPFSGLPLTSPHRFPRSAGQGEAGSWFLMVLYHTGFLPSVGYLEMIPITRF